MSVSESIRSEDSSISRAENFPFLISTDWPLTCH